MMHHSIESSQANQFRQIIAVQKSPAALRVLTHLLSPGDNVVEIGSQLGPTTVAMRDMVVADGGTVTAFDFHRKKATRSGLESFRSTDSLEGVAFHLLTPPKQRFANGAAKNPLQIATNVLRTLLTTRPNIKQYRVVVLDLSNMYGNEMFLDFVVALDVFKSIFSALGMQYLVVKSHFMRSAARRFIVTSQLIDKSAAVEGTRCHAFFRQFEVELANAIAGQRVGYADPGPVVLGARGVDEYRKGSLLCVSPGDRVLEIGCHCGKTTKMLAKAGASAVGVDIGPNIVKEAIKRYPDVVFHEADAWDLKRLMALSKEPSVKEETKLGTAASGEQKSSIDSEHVVKAELLGYDVILVDVGGLSGDNGLYESLSLIRELSHMFRPRLKAIVIKSACVRNFAAIMTGDRWVYLRNLKMAQKSKLQAQSHAAQLQGASEKIVPSVK